MISMVEIEGPVCYYYLHLKVTAMRYVIQQWVFIIKSFVRQRNYQKYIWSHNLCVSKVVWKGAYHGFNCVTIGNQEKLCQLKNMFKTFRHTERSVLENCVIRVTRDRHFVGISQPQINYISTIHNVLLLWSLCRLLAQCTKSMFHQCGATFCLHLQG